MVVSLEQGKGFEGSARGDVFRSIEAVIGSDYGDILVGDGRANTLIGLGGRDILIGGGGDDTLSGRDGADTIYGGTGQDTIRGGRGNDELRGGPGRDSLSGGPGRDDIYGGGGVDTAVYSGNRAAYQITFLGDEMQIGARKTSEGSDTLHSVERLKFADGEIRVRDLRNDAQHDEQIARRLLNWTWDLTGRDEWGNVFRGTLDFSDVAKINRGWNVEGEIAWTANDNVSFVIGIEDAIVCTDLTFATQETFLASGSDPRLRAADYFGSFDDDLKNADGSWYGNGTILGKWEAARSVAGTAVMKAADLGLAGSRWFLLGEDSAGTEWEADIRFETARNVAGGVDVEGSFAWHAIGTSRYGTEFFEASVTDDLVFETTDTWYEVRPPRFAEGEYLWTFDATGNGFQGTWGGIGIPGQFAGSRIEKDDSPFVEQGTESASGLSVDNGSAIASLFLGNNDGIFLG